jgi:DNA-binding NarL/FixJ family response regulator
MEKHGYELRSRSQEDAMMSGAKTIVIAEDHTILRAGLRMLLSSTPAFSVIGEARDGVEAVHSVESLKPDLVLLDLSMPHMDGMEAIPEIKGRNPSTKILVLTVHNAEETVLRAMHSGADGYVLKGATYKELVQAINEVFAGMKYLSPDVAEKVTTGYLTGRNCLKTSSSWDTLTHRERQILKMIAEDHKNRDIARLLGLSEKTVEKHRTNMMRKLDLHSASALTAYAIEKGMVVH